MGTTQEISQSQVDDNVLNCLPAGTRVLEVAYHGESAWAKAMRIKVRSISGTEEEYFMKISTGHHGREALKGEFAATSEIYSITPDFCPMPIAWGTFRSDPESHFYLCKFCNFTDGIPEPESFCEKLARLHSRHEAPGGMFGFHCTTYNGDIPQDNTPCESWEAFFSKALRHIFNIRDERAGKCQELDDLLPALFETVIPRLLRPLESDGRKVFPSLVHGDLWYGNAGITNAGTEEGIVFDPSSFWAHNEYELGNWRPARNKFSDRYSLQYHEHMPWSEPAEDYDDRIALYSLKFNLHAAALFPSEAEFLQMVIEEIQRLTKLYSSESVTLSEAEDGAPGGFRPSL